MVQAGVNLQDIRHQIEKQELYRRHFTVQAITNTECLTLTMSDLDVIKRDFSEQMISFL
jgi:hypothetical protein